MAATAPHINTELDTVENHDAALAHKVGDLSVNDRDDVEDEDISHEDHDHEDLPNGHRDAPDYYASEKAQSVRSGTGGAGLLAARPSSTKSGGRPSSALGQHEYAKSPLSGGAGVNSARQSLSRAPGSPHSEYTHQTEDRPDVQKRASRSYQKPIPIVTTYEPELPDNMSLQRRHSKTGSTKRSGSRAGSIRDGPAAPGEVMSPERQRELQRVSLVDNGPDGSQRESRPRSAFGYRPEPVLGAVQEEGAYGGGRESRAGGILGRSGTTVSRAGTLGRNGALSRGANGGTIGSRKGAFGRGAGASIGTQPEEVLGRDDIHTRAELSERILDDSTLRRLTTMEKKDAKRLSKVIKQEGKAEQKAVTGSIKELERLVKLQREAAANERKSQLRLSKWTSREHKARLRFLKEKERYERIEGELRNAENDYEERRDHAGGLTAQVAEKTQDLDDLRGQKAADDRERAVKLLALKNPAHS